MRIRDPIHGTLEVSDEEKAVVDSAFYQRLRHVKQLGFGDLAFPGATHTRHAHSLGAMHVASRLFDAVVAKELSPRANARMRAAVRLAVLCHDLGHMPLSHASERIAPARAKLGLPGWLQAPADAQATHEDFTAQLLLRSSLAELIRTRYAVHDLSPEAVVSLVTGDKPPGGHPFHAEGVDWWPLMRALVSGELDADRMDYLLRDSFFTGVNYGRYDLDWVTQNLHPAHRDGRVHLALSRTAAFAFEDFLLSRYHMFVSVYFHHTAVNFDEMLRRFYAESPGEFEIPCEPERFLYCDDVALAQALRASNNRWAKRLVARQAYKLLAQFTDRDEGYDLRAIEASLSEAGVDHFVLEARAVLSKYAEEGAGPPLFIIDLSTGRLTEVARYTPLYQRYSGAVKLSFAFVAPEALGQARALLEELMERRP